MDALEEKERGGTVMKLKGGVWRKRDCQAYSAGQVLSMKFV